jgi:hypothetical protein
MEAAYIILFPGVIKKYRIDKPFFDSLEMFDSFPWQVLEVGGYPIPHPTTSPNSQE